MMFVHSLGGGVDKVHILSQSKVGIAINTVSFWLHSLMIF